MTATEQRTTLATAAALVVAGTALVFWPESSAPNEVLWPEGTGPSVTISWNHPATNVSFNVYSATTPSLSGMTLRTNTTEKTATLPANRWKEFFAVRAVRGTNLSPWGTK
jgi:hypothetical protein